MVLQLNGVRAVKESGPAAEDKEPVVKETTKTGSTGSVDPDVNSPSGVTGPADFRGRLLVIPMDGSHWFDVKAVAQEMGRRGHQVTVVIPELSMRMGPGKHYKTVTYPVPYGQEEINALMDQSKENIRLSPQPFFQMISAKIAVAKKSNDFFIATAESLLFNTSLISHLSEQMSLLETVMSKVIYWQFSQVASKFLEEDVRVADVLADTAIWLLRYDFTTEFPRPLVPNTVLVGGINCNIRNPLPEDLEAWVSTGQHGFIVFTLGSLVSSMPEELTVIFLEAFRQIPQKVLWRHSGPYPDNIPENVKMMKWLPQNDLLAHHRVRAFITHGGTHGLYEGLCHAVPMLMVPVTHEQPGNAHRMASRGVGVVLDFQSITVETLLQGLNDVIHDTRYKDNVVKLSALHKDRPIDPLDLSVFWTEFVMRHKGARHLRSAALDLNWFQYYSLDVIVLLVTVLLSVLIVTVKCMKLCLKRIKSKRKQE
ncbi:UDP-glucuronosyltransferase 1A1-like [Aplochiton taeniatus]